MPSDDDEVVNEADVEPVIDDEVVPKQKVIELVLSQAPPPDSKWQWKWREKSEPERPSWQNRMIAGNPLDVL